MTMVSIGWRCCFYSDRDSRGRTKRSKCQKTSIDFRWRRCLSFEFSQRKKRRCASLLFAFQLKKNTSEDITAERTAWGDFSFLVNEALCKTKERSEEFFLFDVDFFFLRPLSRAVLLDHKLSLFFSSFASLFFPSGKELPQPCRRPRSRRPP